MKQRHSIIRGAFILTITGFITRFIGFFYRIFLSRVFGEEGVGVYQLIFPIYALGFSLTCAGIEIAISRTVATKSATGNNKEARNTLHIGCFFSLIFSLLFMITIQNKSTFISSHILNDTRCVPLLIIISYALPFAAMHSCICGYYLGLKQTKIPALSQFIEQFARVISVYFIYLFYSKNSETPNILLAVVGIVIGELASSAFCFFSFRHNLIHTDSFFRLSSCIKSGKELLVLSIPLTANRVLLNILQSIEAISIPLRLQLYGYNTSQALAIYGVLTGMAFPCILFPSALTNSIASMLLPAIAELQATDNSKRLFPIIKKVTFFCSSLGVFCGLIFIILGPFIGSHIFHSNLAGDFLVTMAWICPFLYANGNLISIINGLGKTFYSFFFNTTGLLIRICSIFFLIPICGIRGYLSGLLVSQIVIFLLCLFYLYAISHHLFIVKKKIAP